MSIGSTTVLMAQMEQAAANAGLVVAATEPGVDFSGNPTTKFTIALAADPSKAFGIELTERFEFGRPDLHAEVKLFLAEAAQRLRNPRPDVYLTLTGLPLSFGKFAWPFHHSSSGADTSLVHGEIKLEDGENSPLHAKISASMTVTFAEVVAAMEQPFAEGFIYNAIRKTMDQGQLELVKSGNRQPVPITTRYYSMKQKKFVFNDTTEAQRREFLAGKVYWLSGVLGAGQPVWLLDPRDAQYLNTTVSDLKQSVTALVSEGLITLAPDAEYAIPTEKLMGNRAQYEVDMADALAFIKPTFNEEMRGGHTNM
ncbi:hypothetical protein [Granulicella sibirica]|uniref:Uncharacterized protein n=1 Tax=Granulicella sibirica TaxID=2479048 RepID=A0A4Q0T9L2_9BACT|nr:hypothetical protein [Granulicella sibirica]RXH58739.1 hypothetical protein GRAN_2049 [Granulicella sibirica]